MFGNTQEKTLDLAINHTKIVRQLTEEYTAKYGTIFRYEYSPETFSQTEPDFAIQMCEAVKTAWGKAGPADDRIIFNLPATVEIGPPNHYADLVCDIWLRCCSLHSFPFRSRISAKKLQNGKI